MLAYFYSFNIQLLRFEVMAKYAATTFSQRQLEGIVVIERQY